MPSLSIFKQQYPQFAKFDDASILAIAPQHGLDVWADDATNVNDTSLPQRVLNTASAIGQGLYDLPVQAGGYLANLAEGTTPLAENNIFDRMAAASAQRTQERASAPDANAATLLPTVTKSDIGGAFQNLPFSLGSMGGAFAGGALGSLASPGGSYLGGAAASAAMAQRSTAGQFMRDALNGFVAKYAQEHNGQLPDRATLEAEQARLESFANTQGNWEAGTEALMGPLANKMVGNVFAPGGNVVQKGLKAAGVLGASEMIPETVTGQGQYNNQIEAGVSSGTPRSWLSAEDLGTSFGEVVKPVLLNAALMGGGAAAIKKAFDYGIGSQPAPVDLAAGPTVEDLLQEARMNPVAPAPEMPQGDSLTQTLQAANQATPSYSDYMNARGDSLDQLLQHAATRGNDAFTLPDANLPANRDAGGLQFDSPISGELLSPEQSLDLYQPQNQLTSDPIDSTVTETARITQQATLNPPGPSGTDAPSLGQTGSGTQTGEIAPTGQGQRLLTSQEWMKFPPAERKNLIAKVGGTGNALTKWEALPAPVQSAITSEVNDGSVSEYSNSDVGITNINTPMPVSWVQPNNEPIGQTTATGAKLETQSDGTTPTGAADETGVTVDRSPRLDKERFKLVAVNDKTGDKTELSGEPLTHKEAVVMKSKFSRYPDRTIQLEPILQQPTETKPNVQSSIPVDSEQPSTNSPTKLETQPTGTTPAIAALDKQIANKKRALKLARKAPPSAERDRNVERIEKQLADHNDALDTELLKSDYDTYANHPSNAGVPEAVLRASHGTPAPIANNDSFTIKRYENGDVVERTFNRGEYASYLVNKKPVRGIIEGISHAKQQVKINGNWHDFMSVEKAEAPEVFEKKKEKTSKVIDQLNKKADLNDSDRVPQQSLIDSHKAITDRIDEFKSADKPAKFSFAGEKAATADKSQLAIAQERLAKGDDPEQIRKETGWHIGVDGKARFEIDDSVAKLKPDGENARDIVINGIPDGKTVVTVGDVLEHNNLLKAYPAIKDIEIQFTEEGKTHKGSLGNDGEKTYLLVNKDLSRKELKSTMLHELQHAIQEKEGFATGANTNQFKEKDITDELVKPLDRKILDLMDSNPEFGKLLRKKNREFIRLTDKYGKDFNWDDVSERDTDNYFEILDQLSKFPENLQYIDLDQDRIGILNRDNKLTPFDQYKRQAGETEARNVQTRANLTAEQRRNTSPKDTQDVRDEDQIVTRNNGVQNYQDILKQPLKLKNISISIEDGEGGNIKVKATDIIGKHMPELKDIISQYKRFLDCISK